MDPEYCYICNTKSVFYSRNLYKTKSKYSETRICEFVQNFLSGYPTERIGKPIDSSNNVDCVCIECLNKIDEYDMATMTAKRVENELREILLHTEASFFRETKSFNAEELFMTPIETIDEYKNECHDGNDEEGSEQQFGRSKEQSDGDEEYKCYKCNLQLKGMNAVAQHECIAKKPRFECSTCPESFTTKAQYDQHLKQHKEEDDQFKCIICGFDLKEKTALDEHKQLHAGLSPLQCVLCEKSKSFKQKGALVRHMRIHSGLHFYQCDRCGKGFVHKSSFEMHLLAHDDIRKKKCPHCNQMFRSTSHLNRHLRIHTGSKPFSCPICGQKFAQRYNMSVHQRLHDTSSNRLKSDKTHICKFCNSAFARQSKLEEHLKKNHEAVIPHTIIGNNLDDKNNC